MKSLSTDGVWLYDKCSNAVLIGNITRSSLHNYVIMKMVLHAKKTDSNGTLYVNLAETILLDRSSIQCRAHYTVMTIFECVFIICLSLCVFLFLSNLLCFFRFHSMENVNDSVNLHANSQFHWITANFLVPIFCSLSSICWGVRKWI